MGNIFLNIPVPTSNSTGAAVDVSQMGATKTVIVGGPFNATVIIEYSTDEFGLGPWATLPDGTFKGSGRVTFDFAAHWMRAKTEAYRSGTPNADVGGSNAGADFLLITAAPVDISALAALKTVVTSGAAIIEVSEDGVSWSQAFSLLNAGGVTARVYGQFARLTGSAGSAWMGGAHDGPGGGSQPFNQSTKTIYARPASEGGSDVLGNGSLQKPYRTFQRAVLDVPACCLPAGLTVNVDITNVTEVLPDNYTLPSWKAPTVYDDDVNDPFFLLNAAINIKADPRLVMTVPAGDATIVPGAFNFVADPVTGLLTITLTGAPRASWGGNALKGKFVVGTGVAFEPAVISESTTTTLLITTSAPLTGPIKIMEPSAHLSGKGTGVATGALNAINCDSIAFSGIKITSTIGGVGLLCVSSGFCIAQLCELESPDIESRATFLNRIARNWIYGAPVVAGDLFLNQGFMDACTGLTFYGNPSILQFRRVIFDGCDSVGAIGLTQGGTDIQAAVPVFSLISSLIRNGISSGAHFNGSCGRFEDVDIYGCAGDGISAKLGHGVLELNNVRTTGAASGGEGIVVNDGMFVKVDAATSAATVGANKALTGASGTGMQVGSGAFRTFANFLSGGDGRPVQNEYDVTAAAATGATGTGSRLYQ